jgi:hypothetical protein
VTDGYKKESLGMNIPPPDGFADETQPSFKYEKEDIGEMPSQCSGPDLAPAAKVVAALQWVKESIGETPIHSDGDDEASAAAAGLARRMSRSLAVHRGTAEDEDEDEE